MENSDISGVGVSFPRNIFGPALTSTQMIIGYILDHILGFLLSSCVLMIGRDRHPQLMKVLARGVRAFHDCASFFAFSVKVASMVLLIRVDLGISTTGMGDNTVKITFAVSMLVLLPLAYAVLAIPAHGDDKQSEHRLKIEPSRSKQLVLVVLCWALAFYPFYSAMNAAFGPSRISSAKNAALSTEELDTLEHMYF